ncbi:cardiolipin synthase [Peribacillus sp. SCS-155]|uniref:cardiolipin synthase n=1 Tax=Peribacillus sedimenti TaxID=3115297 RepID=UPI003906A927
MKKQRLEILFLFILSITGYIARFSNYNHGFRLVCAAIYVVLILGTIYSLMLENRASHNTLLWMYVLVFIPIIGYLFYLYSGQLYLKGYLFKTKRRKGREEWERHMRNSHQPDLSFLNDNQQCFAKFASKASFTPISVHSQTTVLKNGEETFSEIIRRLKKAREFIHIEYYIFRSDRLGKEIIDILMNKAREGVEVLFIYDAAGSMRLSKRDIAAMQEAGVKVHCFLPLKYGFFNQKFNFRNHRKIIIIDGEIGFVGGLNVGVEYLGEDERIGYWRDTHMMLKGEAVYTLHTVFLLDWDYVSGENLLKKRTDYEPNQEIGDGAVQIVASGPDTQQGIMSDFYYSLISCATKSIWIATPYFVPNEAIKAALRIAAGKGIEVRVLVPEINDSFLTHYASQSYFSELLRSGVKIYSYKKGFLHQKIIIVDGELASIGTANMDLRSFHLNFEVNVFLFGTHSIQDLISHYEQDLEESERIRPVYYHKRGMMVRTKESIARLFSGVL